MGHRALVAYERPNGMYNLHYSHRGALHLRLKNEIASATPLGGGEGSAPSRSLFEELLQSTDLSEVNCQQRQYEKVENVVEPKPTAINVEFDEILRDHLDYLDHEAFYVVDRNFDVTAYRTLWFGLQYDSESVSSSPTVGNGALRSLRWYDGQPVNDGFVQGEFRALKSVVGDLIDRGVFSHDEAIEYMKEKLAAWTGDQEEIIIRTAE